MLAAWALIVPLTLDTFAVSAALGLQGLTAAERRRVTVLFTAFEGAMPLLGALAGRALDQEIGAAATWVAAGVLAAAGILMLVGPEDEDRLRGLLRRRGPAFLLLGLTVSVDEIAIGLSIGLLHLPLWAACAAIAAQAAVASQVGLRLGHRVGERLRENAERVAGVALIGLAILVAILH